MAAFDVPGGLGAGTNQPEVDCGTGCLQRSPGPGPTTCDPSVLERAGYVNTAWELAKARYVLKAIVSHTSKDFADIMASILPGVITAVEILAVSTGIGAGIGALAGGVGAGPGAAAGFAVGLEILDLLGVGFLAAYVGSKIGTVGS